MVEARKSESTGRRQKRVEASVEDKRLSSVPDSNGCILLGPTILDKLELAGNDERLREIYIKLTTSPNSQKK